eukprot:2344183-Alexandrium_andersonii.AAC.1
MVIHKARGRDRADVPQRALRLRRMWEVARPSPGQVAEPGSCDACHAVLKLENGEPEVERTCALCLLSWHPSCITAFDRAARGEYNFDRQLPPTEYCAETTDPVFADFANLTEAA